MEVSGDDPLPYEGMSSKKMLRELSKKKSQLRLVAQEVIGKHKVRKDMGGEGKDEGNEYEGEE